MPLAGLPAAISGSVVGSSTLSVLCSILGLLLLRASRPKVVRKRRREVFSVVFVRLQAILGALFLFAGLVLQQVPYMVGAYSETEGRAFKLVQCTLVLVVWAWESCFFRSCRTAANNHILACVGIWLGSTIVQWAGPRPYDNILVGFDGQIGGCDGGYRTPFLIYASIWVTSIIFGVLLIVCEQFIAASEDDELLSPRSDAAKRGGKLSTIAFPAIFAMSLSMSGLAFAVGTASNHLGFVFFASVLLVLCVCCSWDAIWRLELSLTMWVALSQGLSSIAHLVQTHLAFRDLRWDAPNGSGPLIVKRMPGLPLFVIGFFVLVATLLFLLDGLSRWREEEDDEEAQPLEDELTIEGTDGLDVSPAQYLQVSVLCICVGCYLLGITMPMIETNLNPPHVILDGHVTGLGNGITPKSKSMLEAISLAYTQQLPCTALIIIFQFVIIPPFQFAGMLALILKPAWFPADLYPVVQNYIADSAPLRFANPFMVMVFVAGANLGLEGPTGKIVQAEFLSGIVFMLGYVFTTLVLAQMLHIPERAQPLRANSIDGLDALSDASSQSEDEDGTSWAFVTAASCLLLIPIVSIAIICALRYPFLTVQLRLSGAILDAFEPTMLDLYDNLSATSPLFGLLALITFLGTLVPWFILLLVRIPLASGCSCECLSPVARASKRAEMGIRPWVMTHVWALCLALVYYVATSRNKAIVEVCVALPPTAIGVVSLGIMYGGMLTLFACAKTLSPQNSGGIQNNEDVNDLPGGPWLWKVAPALTAVFIFAVLYMIGPKQSAEFRSVNDLNVMLEGITPFASNQMQKKLPHVAGDCLSRWQHRVKSGEANGADEAAAYKDCRGNAPLTKLVHERTNITVRWAEGLDTLVLKEMRITPPPENAYAQRWNFTLSAEFTDLHIWLKVMLGDQVWDDDYMCCDNPFHIQLQASAMCTDDHGFFSPISVEVSQLDALDFKHTSSVQDGYGDTFEFQADYGKFAKVQDSIRKQFKNMVNQFRLQHPDGRVTNPLDAFALILQDVVKYNSGQRCLHFNTSLN